MLKILGGRNEYIPKLYSLTAKKKKKKRGRRTSIRIQQKWKIRQISPPTHKEKNLSTHSVRLLLLLNLKPFSSLKAITSIWMLLFPPSSRTTPLTPPLLLPLMTAIKLQSMLPPPLMLLLRKAVLRRARDLLLHLDLETLQLLAAALLGGELVEFTLFLI